MPGLSPTPLGQGTAQETTHQALDDNQVLHMRTNAVGNSVYTKRTNTH
jgi:hypothetical protein